MSKIVPIVNVMNAIIKNIPFNLISLSRDLTALPAKISPVYVKRIEVITK